VFLRARYYEPLTGRFLSLDPWRGNERRPGTLNRYVYVLNNSINGTDPSGLRCLFFDKNCDEIAGEAWDWLTGKADEAVDYVDNKVRGSTGSSGSLLGGLSSMAVNYLAGMILEFADSQSLGLLSNTLIPSWYTDDDPFFVMGRHGGRGVSDALGAIELAWGSFCGGATIVEAAVPGGQPVAVLTGVGYFVLTAHGGAVLTANRMRPLPPVVFAETGHNEGGGGRKLPEGLEPGRAPDPRIWRKVGEGRVPSTKKGARPGATKIWEIYANRKGDLWVRDRLVGTGRGRHDHWEPYNPRKHGPIRWD
jgi:hypothetical protein